MLKVFPGDANCDGKVELADAILIMQSIANPDKYGLSGYDTKHLTHQGSLNGDVDKNIVGLTSNDALFIQRCLLNLETLPPKEYEIPVTTTTAAPETTRC